MSEELPVQLTECGKLVLVSQQPGHMPIFATDLDLLLKGLGVNTLVLTGVATDVCVRATGQDVLQLDYRVWVPHECVAGTNEARHLAALEHIGCVLGRVSLLVLIES